MAHEIDDGHVGQPGGATQRQVAAAEEFRCKGELYVRLAQQRLVVEIEHDGGRAVALQHYHRGVLDLA